MIRKLTSLTHKILLILLVALVAIGAGVYLNNHKKTSIKAPQYPQYLNFDGSYVFSVPKTYSVDEQSIPGAQLIYTGTIQARTVEDVYNANGIAVQGVTDLTDHSSKAFKNYVNDKYLPDLEKNLSTNDVKVKFGKENGQDTASIIVNKDGKQTRFIFLKNGQHPAVVVSKQENDIMKTIDGSILDVEASALKGEIDQIKQSVMSIAQLIKSQKAHDLYVSAAPDLQSKNTEAQLAAALQSATSYTSGNIVISGITYSPGDFSAGMRMTKLDKNDQQPAFGLITGKKIDGQWKLQALSLPTSKQ